MAALGLKGLTIGSAFISVAGFLPSSAILINRAIGLGLSELENRETIRTILAVYRDEHVSRYLLQVHPEAKPLALVEWLEDAGLVKARGWQMTWGTRLHLGWRHYLAEMVGTSS